MGICLSLKPGYAVGACPARWLPFVREAQSSYIANTANPQYVSDPLPQSFVISSQNWTVLNLDSEVVSSVVSRIRQLILVWTKKISRGLWEYIQGEGIERGMGRGMY